MAGRRDDSARRNRPLTMKEQRFVQHYLETWNGHESARVAGYSVNCAAKPERILRQAPVRAAIEAKRREIEERFEQRINETYIVSQLVREVEERADMTPASRVAALGLLAKIKGIVIDRQAQVTTKGHDVARKLERYTEDELAQMEAELAAMEGELERAKQRSSRTH